MHTEASPANATSDWRGSISQNRLSSIFDGWLRPSTPTSPVNRASAVFTPDNSRKSVSEPMLVEQNTGHSFLKSDRSSWISNVEDQESEVDLADFDEMLACTINEKQNDRIC